MEKEKGKSPKYDVVNEENDKRHDDAASYDKRDNN